VLGEKCLKSHADCPLIRGLVGQKFPEAVGIYQTLSASSALALKQDGLDVRVFEHGIEQRLAQAKLP
jgi:hypothetical protein